MTYGEARRHVMTLLVDPSSHITAAMSGWDYPITREDIALREFYDLTHEIAWVQGGKKGKRPTRYPRPWPNKTKTVTKPSPDLTQEEIVAALRMAGHHGPIPLKAA